MTAEEAKTHVEYGWGDGILLGGEMNDELQKTIIYALEKQIPKKPTPVKNSYVANKCAVCGASVAVWDFYHEIIKRDYCHECGQRIDWSKEAEA